MQFWYYLFYMQSYVYKRLYTFSKQVQLNFTILISQFSYASTRWNLSFINKYGKLGK